MARKPQRELVEHIPAGLDPASHQCGHHRKDVRLRDLFCRQSDKVHQLLFLFGCRKELHRRKLEQSDPPSVIFARNKHCYSFRHDDELPDRVAPERYYPVIQYKFLRLDPTRDYESLILALKGLTHPSTARRGNFFGMAGMALAIVATLLGGEVQSYGFIVAGVLVGGLIGVVLAMRIQMTAMPQLVAALHSFVGLAAVLVAVGTFLNKRDAGLFNAVLMGELSAGAVIGAVTFTGSVIAFGKLQGLISGKPVKFAMQHQLNATAERAAFIPVEAFLPGRFPFMQFLAR